MNKGGRVLLDEAVITDGNDQDFGKLLDIEMLVSPGRKRKDSRRVHRPLETCGPAADSYHSYQITLQRH
jgi:hypothetical protein